MIDVRGARDQVLAVPDAARCRSLRAASRADDMRARYRPKVGLSEVQEGREAPGSDVALACAALTPSSATEQQMTTSSPHCAFSNTLLTCMLVVYIRPDEEKLNGP